MPLSRTGVKYPNVREQGRSSVGSQPIANDNALRAFGRRPGVGSRAKERQPVERIDQRPEGEGNASALGKVARGGLPPYVALTLR